MGRHRSEQTNERSATRTARFGPAVAVAGMVTVLAVAGSLAGRSAAESSQGASRYALPPTVSEQSSTEESSTEQSAPEESTAERTAEAQPITVTVTVTGSVSAWPGRADRNRVPLPTVPPRDELPVDPPGDEPIDPNPTEEPTTGSTTPTPTATQPSTTEPSTTEPSTTQPSSTKTSSTQPSTTKTSTTEPTSETSTTEPSTTEPTSETSTTEPSTTEPTSDPTSSEPSTTRTTTSTSKSTTSTPKPTTTTSTPKPTTTPAPGRTVHDGNLVVTTSGTVIDNMEIRGRLIIQAANVTVNNSLILGPEDPGSAGRGGIVQNTGGSANLVIKNSSVRESHPSVNNTECVVGSNFTLENSTVEGCIDNVQIRGSNVTISNSTLKNTVKYAHDSAQNGGPSHNDNVQVLQGDNILIEGNTITGSQNFAILGASEQGSMKNLRVRNNFVDGGGWTMKFSNKTTTGSVNPNSVFLGGNRFGGNAAQHVDLVVARGMGFTDQGGNIRTDTNEPVKVSWVNSGG